MGAAGGAADAAGVAETHSGLVFFAGDRAYKLKKPVDLGFLDFRTREVREAVCHREVELNGRLAPDVYLGVADVLGPDGQPCDHLIVMRRMPDDRRLSTLVTSGADVMGHLHRLARVIAGFHGRADRHAAADHAAGVDALSARWAANTAGLHEFAPRFVPSDQVDEVDDLARRYLAGRRPLFDRRIAEGRACDGHGDLLADDIFCLDDGPRVLDCIEFDDALRYGDALADVAFLAMDLERLGRIDLAQLFLDAYREFADDSWPASLAHHHIAYRAQVRAKVTAIRAGQGYAPAAEKARQRLDLARAHLDAARVRLVVVGGLPGTGKSTLAAGLGEALGAVVLRTDEVRKELGGVPVDQSAAAAYGEGLYTGERTEATYREVLHRAAVALRFGETVVVDASWSSGEHRDAARRLAEETCSDLVELRCSAPRELAAARLRYRSAAGGDPSDADAAVAAAMADVADPWPEATVVDTRPGPADVLSSTVTSITTTKGEALRAAPRR
jgi:uncharacterized protein